MAKATKKITIKHGDIVNEDLNQTQALSMVKYLFSSQVDVGTITIKIQNNK
jgi:hypothetical protein